MTMVSPAESRSQQSFGIGEKVAHDCIDRPLSVSSASLDDIAPTHSTRRLPCNDEPC